MAIRDILFPMTSYPVPTPAAAVEKAVELAAGLGARISGMAFELDIRSPVGLYADVLNVAGILAAERRRSAANTRDLIALFSDVATRRAATSEHSVERCTPAEVPSLVVEHAKFRDLTVFPLKEADPDSRRTVEAVIFESGRPVLLLPEVGKRELPSSIANVAIAWDHSRPATRAVADALPFLQAAKHVHVFTVIDEKRFDRPETGAELSRHLAQHGVEMTFEAVRSNGRSIGDVVEERIAQRNIDLLVMGAYGHSRIREFILGGATQSMLSHPVIWTLLSH